MEKLFEDFKKMGVVNAELIINQDGLEKVRQWVKERINAREQFIHERESIDNELLLTIYGMTITFKEND